MFLTEQAWYLGIFQGIARVISASVFKCYVVQVQRLKTKNTFFFQCKNINGPIFLGQC